MIQVFYCTSTREYTNIPSCRGETRLRLVPHKRGNICIYTHKTRGDGDEPGVSF